jgi:hypothetical protein
MINNNKGSISLIGLMCTLILIAYGLINIATSLKELQVHRFRQKSYLCTKKTLKSIDTYFNYIQKSNVAIRVLYFSGFNIFHPASAIAARRARKALISVQNAYHLSFIYKLKSNKYCEVINTTKLLTSLPVHTKNIVVLHRDWTGMAKLKNHWSNQLVFFAPKSISRAKESFIVKMEIRKKDSMWVSKFKIKTEELGIRAMLQSNQFLGQLL